MKKALILILSIISITKSFCQEPTKTITATFVKAEYTPTGDGDFVIITCKKEDGTNVEFSESANDFLVGTEKELLFTQKGPGDNFTKLENVGKKFSIVYVEYGGITSVKVLASNSNTVTNINAATTIPSGSVKIGNQIWTTKNLDVDHYRNGDVIPEVKDPQEWAKLTTGAWCYYHDTSSSGDIYGRLYNWYAVNDQRGLAPKGYHIPSKEEWLELVKYLGGPYDAIQKMKNNKGWAGESLFGIENPDQQGTNESGFGALPGGVRAVDGGYYFVDSDGEWWSSTAAGSNWVWTCKIHYNKSSQVSIDNHANYGQGSSVRCIKDK